MRNLLAISICVASLGAACNNSGGKTDLGGDLGTTGDAASGPDLAVAPIVAPKGTWTWIDVPGNVCDDGSPTGIGVNFGDSDKLLVYFEGGGACGDYITCYQLNTAVHGPFGEAEFTAAAGERTNNILDRATAGAPFSSYTMVYVPYCTGDVHSGNTVQMYTGQGQTKAYHHAGHTNALNALAKLAATWPTLTKLVVTGSSAGGYGASINYNDYRSRWSSAAGYLVDDSGPQLESSVTPQSMKTWYLSWGVLSWLMTLCPDCTGEPAKLYPTLAKLYPNDRMSLLSSLQDFTISAFYGFSGNAAGFQTALLQLATDYLDPNPNFRHFFVTGSTHTMLLDPQTFSSNSVPLLSWLTQLVTNDTAWVTQQPPAQ